MLAQNFLPAEALGITETERSALMTTLLYMESGKIPADEFHMKFWNKSDAELSDCGSACCIGGWAKEITGVQMQFEYNTPIDRLFNTPIDRLMFPRHYPKAYECTSLAKGAHALRNFLVFGEADWETVLAE